MKSAINAGYQTFVRLQSTNDYYPFGSQLPGREYDAGSYRFGFNGKENDDETYGEGNFQDYGMRMYDTRVGRFVSVDPIFESYPMLSPYQFASNSPISGIDLDGLEWSYFMTQTFGGVGMVEITLEGSAGVVAAGAKAKASIGLAYDSHCNFAMCFSTGAFADFIENEKNLFTLSFEVESATLEHWYWEYDNVMDISGKALSASGGINAYYALGFNVGIDMNSSSDVTGISTGPTVGLGGLMDYTKEQTSTSMFVFNEKDIQAIYNSQEIIKTFMESSNISDYYYSLSTREGSDGYTELIYDVSYKLGESIVNFQLSTGVSYTNYNENVTATKNALETLNE